MKRTQNSPNFYYVKQLICLLQVCRLKRVIELNGVELTLEEIHKELKDELASLRDNFLMPELTLKTSRSVIDYKNVYARLKEAKNNAAIYYHPSLEDSVKNMPNLAELTKTYKLKFDERGEIDDVKDDIVKLVDFANTLFNDLYAFVENKEPSLYFEQAIAWVNMLACIEFFFTLSEMGEYGFTVKDDGEDNPWVD